ncbi:Rop family plasmid primer RNA-binding protein, partial [Klebsiella pneumoniae]
MNKQQKTAVNMAKFI